MATQSEWWKPFFSGLWGHVLRQFWTPEQTRADADFIEQLLRLPPQAHVLDVPCGEGRLSRVFAERGYQVTGVDGTAAFLDQARQQANAQHLAIHWEHRDMRDLPWEDAFDAAFCFWGSFGYFDDEGNVNFLQAVFRALKPGARFLLETHIAETLLPIFQERGWQRVGDTLMLERRWYDYVQSRVGTEWTFVHAGTMETVTSSIRMYTYRELGELFRMVGFVPGDAYDTRSRQPFAFGARRLTIVAEKPAWVNKD